MADPWDIQVFSLKRSKEDLEGWAADDDICPRCNEPFLQWKQFKLPDGTIIHVNCSTDDEYCGRT